jgi:hypothetical protein
MRLKHSKLTVFLFADPSKPLTDLKEALFSALEELRTSGTLEDITVPSSPSDIELGKPIDQFDAEQGWELIGALPAEDEDEDDSKKRSSKEKGRTSESNITLRDSGAVEGVLAFRFKQQSSDDDDNTMANESLGDDPGWDVEIAKFEDLYGVENEADLGVLGEFDG